MTAEENAGVSTSETHHEEPMLPELPEHAQWANRPSPFFNELSESSMEQDSRPPITGKIDVASFVRAQAEFIRFQTEFLQRRPNGSQEFIDGLTKYSLAQSDFIDAQSEVLRQLGVL